MGTPAIQAILQGLQQHQERMLSQQQLAQQAAQNIAQNQQRAAELEESLRQHNLEHDVALKQLALSHSLTTAQTQQLQQQIAQNIQTGAPPPPGSTTTQIPGLPTSNAQPDTQMPGGGISLRNSPVTGTPDQEQVQLPDNQGSLTTLTPQAYAIQQAKIASITNAPAEAAKTREQAAAQQAETARQLLTGAQLQASQKEIEQIRATSAESIAKKNNATQLAVASMPYSIFKDMDPQVKQSIVGNYVSAGYDGNMSAKDLATDTSAKGFAGAPGAVQVALGGMGGVFPNDKQVDFIKNSQPLIDLIPKMQEFVSLLPQSSNKPQALMSGAQKLANVRLAALEAEIEGQSSVVAKVMGGDQGQRLQKVMLDLAQQAFHPDRYQATPFNAEIVNNFQRTLLSAYKTNLSSLPTPQLNNIMNKHGLTSYNYLDLKTGMPTSSLVGSGQVPQPNGPNGTPGVQFTHTATNPTTGEKVGSPDGGKTWMPIPKQQ